MERNEPALSLCLCYIYINRSFSLPYTFRKTNPLRFTGGLQDLFL